MPKFNLDLDDFKKILNKTEFDEEPVDLMTFCKDEYYLGMSVTPSPIQINMIEKMSQIFLEPSLLYLYGEEGQKMWEDTVNELICQIGKGGGKDFSFPLFTNVLTKNGILPMGELIGTEQKLLTSSGKWVSSRIEDHGEHEIWEIKLKRGGEGEKRTLRTTEFHQQYATETLDRARCKYDLIFTRDLKPGMWLRTNLGQGINHRNIKLSPIGVMQGFTFGDGTKGKTYFYGDKDEDLVPWFEKAGFDIKHYKYTKPDGSYGKKAEVRGIPYSWKQFPDIQENPGVLYGWLAGYFAADGTVSKEGYCTIASSKKENIDFVRSICSLLGVATSDTRSVFYVNTFNPSGSIGYNCRLMGETLSEEFFLIDKHRERFLGGGDKPKIICGDRRLSQRIHWKVISVTNTKVVEKTACANVPEEHNFTLDGNILTHNSIKAAFSRIIYFLHCLKDPLDYYGKGSGEFIDLINIAMNQEQAKNIFFEPLKQMLSQSPYFQEQGFEPRAREIMFLSRPVRCFSAHSGAEAWEGYNPIAICLDEISAFKTDEEIQGERHRYSASAIYGMARNSVISRFPSIGKVALLSFPRYEGDFIQQRYESVISDKKTIKKSYVVGQFEDEDVVMRWDEDEIISYRVPKVWAIKCPSWYTNPERKPEDYLAAYIDNPVETAGKFLCMPPKAEQAYFRDPKRVRLCFPKEVPRPCDEFGQFNDWFVGSGEDIPPRFIHIDLGLVRDRAALCMTHCVGKKKVEFFDGATTATQYLPVIKMDIIKYWEAKTGSEIKFDEVRNFAFDLSKRFPIAMISLDRWQSVDTINIFKSRGIYAEMHSVSKIDYDTLSSTIYDGRLEAYFDELLVEGELLKLQLINGKKIDHVKAGYKDGADALAGAVWNCVDHTPIEQEIDITILGIGEEKKEPSPPQTSLSAESKNKADGIPPELDEFLKRMKIL
jgi:hypothetical protein